jgi:hypothetical protein
MGKRLLPLLDDWLPRVAVLTGLSIELDDRAQVVTVVDVAHRRDVYRA